MKVQNCTPEEVQSMRDQTWQQRTVVLTRMSATVLVLKDDSNTLVPQFTWYTVDSFSAPLCLGMWTLRICDSAISRANVPSGR